MDQARISMTARSGPAFLRRSNMLATLAGGSVSARGAGSEAPAMVDYEFAAAAPPASSGTIVPGVPDWALAAGGVAIAGAAILLLRKRGKR